MKRIGLVSMLVMLTLLLVSCKEEPTLGSDVFHHMQYFQEQGGVKITYPFEVYTLERGTEDLVVEMDYQNGIIRYPFDNLLIGGPYRYFIEHSGSWYHNPDDSNINTIIRSEYMLVDEYLLFVMNSNTFNQFEVLEANDTRIYTLTTVYDNEQTTIDILESHTEDYVDSFPEDSPIDPIDYMLDNAWYGKDVTYEFTFNTELGYFETVTLLIDDIEHTITYSLLENELEQPEGIIIDDVAEGRYANNVSRQYVELSEIYAYTARGQIDDVDRFWIDIEETGEYALELSIDQDYQLDINGVFTGRNVAESVVLDEGRYTFTISSVDGSNEDVEYSFRVYKLN